MKSAKKLIKLIMHFKTNAKQHKKAAEWHENTCNLFAC